MEKRCCHTAPELWPDAFLFWTYALSRGDAVSIGAQLLTYSDTWISQSPQTWSVNQHSTEHFSAGDAVFMNHQQGKIKTFYKIFSDIPKFHSFFKLPFPRTTNTESITALHSYLIRLARRRSFIYKAKWQKGKSLKTVGSCGVYFITLVQTCGY